MVDKVVVDDPFRGIHRGCLVHIERGPKSVVGKDALVVDRELVVVNSSEDMIEDYEANIEVMVNGERVRLWVGWVRKIVD